jgi:hypothetical protein
MSIKIEKKEMIFAFSGLAVILVWFLLIRKLIAPVLSSFPPILSMIMYNFGLFIGLYLLSAPLNSGKIRWKTVFVTFIVMLGIDILYAPYLVNTNGTIISDFDLWFVSTDAAIGSFYSYFLPQAWIWTMTYIITPTFLMLIFPILILVPKKVAGMFGH